LLYSRTCLTDDYTFGCSFQFGHASFWIEFRIISWLSLL